LQGKPFNNALCVKSATQKSCRGSGSEEREGSGKSNRSVK
jgi:hypothetical protein